ncbi:hypothetical protein [Streptomyces niveus]|uniref:hypothetical protein n=1 Tax=Streptomyces niveus TaxID=193462 RepID=UPI0036C6816F
MSQFQAAADVGAVDELVDSADRRQGEDGRAGDAGGQGPGEAFGVQDPRVISSRDNSFSRSVGRGQCLDRVRQFGNLPRAAVFRRLSSSNHETIAASKNGALHHQLTAEEPHPGKATHRPPLADGSDMALSRAGLSGIVGPLQELKVSGSTCHKGGARATFKG